MFTCIFRRIEIAPPLTAPYDGPYKVVARSGRIFKAIIKGKVETFTADVSDLRISNACLKMSALDSQQLHGR